MAYDNSLTTGVQAHIRTVLAQKLMDANTTAKIGRPNQGLVSTSSILSWKFRSLVSWVRVST